MQSQIVKALRLWQRGKHGMFSDHTKRRVGIAPEHCIEASLRQIGVMSVLDHVFRQPRKRDLRLENVLLWHLSGGVLDARGINCLACNSHVLIVNPQFVVHTKHVVESLAHPHPNVEAHLIQVGFRDIHVRLRHAGAQRPFSTARQCLADAEHVLRGVVIPRLLQWDSPTAIHSHWIVERRNGGDVRFCNCDSAGGNCNLGVCGKCDPLDFFECQGRPGSVARVVFAVLSIHQCSNNRQPVTTGRRLRARDRGGQSGRHNTKYSKKRFHYSLQRRFSA